MNGKEELTLFDLLMAKTGPAAPSLFGGGEGAGKEQQVAAAAASAAARAEIMTRPETEEERRRRLRHKRQKMNEAWLAAHPPAREAAVPAAVAPVLTHLPIADSLKEQMTRNPVLQFLGKSTGAELQWKLLYVNAYTGREEEKGDRALDALARLALKKKKKGRRPELHAEEGLKAQKAKIRRKWDVLIQKMRQGYAEEKSEEYRSMDRKGQRRREGQRRRRERERREKAEKAAAKEWAEMRQLGRRAEVAAAAEVLAEAFAILNGEVLIDDDDAAATGSDGELSDGELQVLQENISLEEALGIRRFALEDQIWRETETLKRQEEQRLRRIRAETLERNTGERA